MLTRELMLEARERAFSLVSLSEIGVEELMVTDMFYEAVAVIEANIPAPERASYLFNAALSLGIIAGRLEYANGLVGADYPDA